MVALRFTGLRSVARDDETSTDSARVALRIIHDPVTNARVAMRSQSGNRTVAHS